MSFEKQYRCVILGGGGHARVLIDTLLLNEEKLSFVILDTNTDQWGKNLYGIPVLGGDHLLPELVREGLKYFVVGVGSVRDLTLRRQLFELGLSQGLQPLSVIHPTAVCSPYATLKPGVQLLPLSIVNAGAKVGANTIVNSGAIVEHDCTVGDHVHIATGARLAGEVKVGTEVHIGAGATILQQVHIGNQVTVGAGAVVIRDVMPNTVVVGVPARPLFGLMEQKVKRNPKLGE